MWFNQPINRCETLLLRAAFDLDEKGQQTHFCSGLPTDKTVLMKQLVDVFRDLTVV